MYLVCRLLLEKKKKKYFSFKLKTTYINTTSLSSAHYSFRSVVPVLYTFLIILWRSWSSTPFPYTTLFRSAATQPVIGGNTDPNPSITFTQVGKTVGIDRSRRSCRPA